MLNEELFFDKKDLEIAKLKQSIDRFKKYDKNRNQNHKKEVSELKIEIGKLKSYIEELESNKDLEKLRTKIKNQKEVILSLERKIHCSKLAYILIFPNGYSVKYGISFLRMWTCYKQSVILMIIFPENNECLGKEHGIKYFMLQYISLCLKLGK